MKTNKTDKELLFERMQYVNPELTIINEDQKSINFYKEQLDPIVTTGEYPAQFFFYDIKGYKTKVMDLNTESAKVLIDWINQNFSNNSQI